MARISVTPLVSANGAAATSTREPLYRIAEVAEQVGVSPATLRAWERQRLIAPLRSGGGYRLFRGADLERVRQVARLRQDEGLNPAGIRRVLGEDAPREPSSRRADDTPIGPHLRRLRKERALTLAQVAHGIGSSVSVLSSAERERAGISIPMLTRLLAFYGTTLADVMHRSGSPRARTGRLTRPGKRPRVTNRFSHVTIEQLANGDIQMEPQLFLVEPGGGSEGAYTHPGEEFIYVLAGTIEVLLDERERYRVKEGDCLYYPSTLPHAWHNPGRSAARLLWVNTPPTF